MIMTVGAKHVQKSQKLVIVGDSMVGKTCLIYAFKDNYFIPSYSPTIFETYIKDIEIEGKRCSLFVYDVSSQDSFARLRPLAYPDAKVVLICFSIDNSKSANSVIQYWNPEVRQLCHSCPVILVGCKIDLRIDIEDTKDLQQEDQRYLTSEDGQRLATEINADAYMECSAKTREGVQGLFIQAAILSFQRKLHRHSNTKCELL